MQMPQEGCPQGLQGYNVCDYVNVDDFDVVYLYTDAPLFLFATCMLLKAVQLGKSLAFVPEW